MNVCKYVCVCVSFVVCVWCRVCVCVCLSAAQKIVSAACRIATRCPTEREKPDFILFRPGKSEKEREREREKRAFFLRRRRPAFRGAVRRWGLRAPSSVAAIGPRSAHLTAINHYKLPITAYLQLAYALMYSAAFGQAMLRSEKGEWPPARPGLNMFSGWNDDAICVQSMGILGMSLAFSERPKKGLRMLM